MPIHIVVRCFECELFQVQMLRKDNKFKCKVCSSSQSIRTKYMESTCAADCRHLVQTYNVRAIENSEQASIAQPSASSEHDLSHPNFTNSQLPDSSTSSSTSSSSTLTSHPTSRWTIWLSSSSSSSDEEEDDDDTQSSYPYPKTKRANQNNSRL